MEQQKKSRRSFTEDYRQEAAGLVIDSDRPVAAVARELGINQQSPKPVGEKGTETA